MLLSSNVNQHVQVELNSSKIKLFAIMCSRHKSLTGDYRYIYEGMKRKDEQAMIMSIPHKAKYFWFFLVFLFWMDGWMDGTAGVGYV